MIINFYYFPTIAAVVIGFEETEVQVLENITDRIKLLCVKVLKGKLTREATVTVKYNDQTVVSKYLTYKTRIYVFS